MKIGGRNNILYTNKKGPKSHGNVVVFQKTVISKSELAPWSWVSHTLEHTYIYDNMYELET